MVRRAIRRSAASNCLLILCLSLAHPVFAQAPTQPLQEADRLPADSAAIGVGVVEIDDEVKSAWRKDDIPVLHERGVLVASVLPGSPAAHAGVKPIDVLVARAHGKVLVNPEQFAYWVKRLPIDRPQRVAVHRPVANQQGRMIWKKLTLRIEPTARAKVEQAALRYGYIRLDDRWLELPFLDLSQPSSQTRPFDPPKEPYHQLPERVVSQRRREWKERLPRIAVGEHGKILGFEVIQILGPRDVIVQIGLEDLGWTLIGVPDRYEWVRLTGVGTAGLVDGRRATIDEPIAVIGTWAYTTTLGAKKTIFLAAPVDLLQRGLSDDELKQLRHWRASQRRP